MFDGDGRGDVDDYGGSGYERDTRHRKHIFSKYYTVWCVQDWALWQLARKNTTIFSLTASSGFETS